ncbi:recombinase family protein [Paracholeplasma manati]|uniref:recombinase family protein n=1 Tax=Paracholeplasma manati TaxID=591373 RepID=UPI002407C0E4|nr:recombinase family protein [Paracholeplasma manati]MDG0889190.1 recombinase family protein [Paracholeplasma manati]
MGKVRVIPSTINPLTLQSINSSERRKVAAYARVSTDSDEQYSSYEAQVKYYKEFIQDRIDWDYVNVYADEGISGTSTKRRASFNLMIKDALEGKINLIITKSISRFARNTLDTITHIRKLKTAGVEVFFEKENLWTFDPKGEMVLSMLAAIAQEESRSISENVKMGIRWSYKEGKVKMPYKNFLGYDKVDGKIAINKNEAEIVRLIYRLFLRDGWSRSSIAEFLNKNNYSKPSKKTIWTTLNITSILTNEKYKGDALLQKGYVENYLDHTVKKNNGVLAQYYVENSHPYIIEKEEWNLVREELSTRERFKYAYSSINPYSSRLICGCCGHFYGAKVWHSNSPHRKVVMQCNKKFINKCDTPSLSKETINERFVQAYNKVMVNKKELIEDTNELITVLSDTLEVDSKIENLNNEISDIKLLIEGMIKDNTSRTQNQDEYMKRYNSHVEKFQTLKDQLDEALIEREMKIQKAEAMKSFVKEIKNKQELIQAFDPVLWNTMLNEAVVNKDNTIMFKFKNERVITI